MDTWLISVLEPPERYTFYIDAFNLHFETLDRLVREEDIVGTLSETIGVAEGSDDFERLHVGWDELREKFLNKRRQLHASLPAAALEPARDKTKLIHPLEDIKMCKSNLNFDVTQLLPPKPVSNVTEVLLTGVTGFVGRVQLVTLLRVQIPPNITVHCLVRAKSADHGLDRIRAACKEAKIWSEEYVPRIVVHPSNFEQERFALTEDVYNDLAQRIDLVYHTGGDVNLLCSYSRLRQTNCLSIMHIIAFATTCRLKPVHFVSTLGQFPSFFAVFSGEFSDHKLDENSQPDMEDMRRVFPPLRQGYPWSKWGAEQVLRMARDKGLPVAIYRLPNTYVAYDTGYTNRTDYATALMIASITEGVFPVGAATAPLTPVDTICEMIVRRSLMEKPKHWLYHLFDPRLLPRRDMEAWAKEMGIKYVGAPVDDFLSLVKSRGPTSPVFRFAPLMSFWRKYWFNPDERKEPFPIGNSNIFDELPDIQWPPMRAIFLNSFLYCMQMGYFPAHARCLYRDVDDALRDAERVSGLPPGLGRESESVRLALDQIQRSFSQCHPTFSGYLSLFRTIRQYAVNLMAMEDLWREHPEIEERPVDAPIVICGLNRSGTTFMQNLLAQDSSTRATRACEMIAPFGKDGSYRPHSLLNLATEDEWRNDPRIGYAQEVLDTQLASNEGWASIHAQNAVAPEEDFIIMEHGARCYSICTAFDVPTYREWLFAENCKEMKAAYRIHKRFLQHLQWQRSGARWILKMPFHLFTLDALFETYPDARVIFTHRDPHEVVASWCSLVSYARRNLTNSEEPNRIGREELYAMELMMKNALEFRQTRPDLAERFLDVHFTDIVTAPMDVIRRIYKFMGADLHPKAERSMLQYIEKNERERRRISKHAYRLQSFALEKAHIQTAFKEYYDSPQYLCQTTSVETGGGAERTPSVFQEETDDEQQQHQQPEPQQPQCHT